MIRALVVSLVGTSAVAQEPDLTRHMAGVPACYAGEEDPSGCVGRFAETCMSEEPQGQTTVGIMSCLLAENAAWDALLNAEYRAAMAAAKALDAEESQHFPEFAHRAENLRNAQRAWIDFRDAECGLAYALWGAGSMRQIAGADCLLNMTSERTIALGSLWEELQ